MSRTPTLLLVEDNDIDREAVRRALRRYAISNQVIDCADGVEALEILRAGHDGEGVPRPFVVLLDLNLPRLGGLEFLREVRADPRLRDSVIFVLTTSAADDDKRAAYRHHVAGYFVKGDLSTMSKLAELLSLYSEIARLPGPLG